VNVNVVGLRVTVMGGTLTLRVTGIVSGLLEAPLEVIVMAPLYVDAAKPAVFTETVKEPGVLPAAGLSDNHDPPDAAAVKAILVPPVMLTTWAAGAVPPIV